MSHKCHNYLINVSCILLLIGEKYLVNNFFKFLLSGFTGNYKPVISFIISW